MLRLFSEMPRKSLLLSLLALLAACAPIPLGEVPQSTLAPTEAVTATPAATEVPPATPTVIAVATNTPNLGAVELAWTSTSPDGQWTATAAHANLHEGDTYFTRLRVEGSTGGQVWTPVNEWRPMGLGYTLPGLVQWSQDGQRLYFSNVPVPDGCALWVNGGDLQVLDLANGQVTELMPEQAMRIALSPDETRLAYIGYGDRGLIIRDLNSGQEESIAITLPTGLAQLGLLQWSPNGTALVLTAAHEPCGPDTATSVVHVDLASDLVSTLVDGDVRGMETVGWTAEGHVVLRDKDGDQWIINDKGDALPAAAPGSLAMLWFMDSPDGQWTALNYSDIYQPSGEQYRVLLTLASADGTRELTVLDEMRNRGMGYTLPQIVRWSADNSRLYFTNVAAVDGCAWFVNGSDLNVVDLATGDVRQLMPDRGLALALSPDETQVAYVGYGERGLTLLDLATGAERPVELPAASDSAAISQLVWSPASDALAVTLIDEACVQLEPSRYLTVHVDTRTGAARTLLDNDPRLLVIDNWPSDGRLQLRDWDGGLWWLDVETGTVTAA